MLAKFAFEFREVVGVHEGASLFSNFAGDPLSEASEVNEGTAALAEARRNERVFFGLLVATTYFTIDLIFFSLLSEFGLINSIAFLVEIGLSEALDLLIGFDFKDNELDPS